MPLPVARQHPNPVWSLMRCVFAFEICLIHLCTSSWREIQPGWMAETAFISLTRAGTVGFMMLSGAILIGRGPGTVGSYLAHRMRRWFPGIIAAQGLYMAYGLWSDGASRFGLTWFDVLEPAWYHVWFFYALALIYFVVVPMRHYAAWAEALAPAPRLAARWVPVALLVSALGWVTVVHGGFWGDLRPVNLIVYCGYAWVGHVLAVTFPRGAPSGWLLFATGALAATVATLLATEAAGQPVPYYFHRCSLFIAVAATGQFLVLLRARDLRWEPRAVERVNHIARLTLGIFVVHPLIIALTGWPHPWALAESFEWVSMPLAAVALFGLSGLVTWLALAAADALRGMDLAIGLQRAR